MSFRLSIFFLLIVTACNPKNGKEKPILSAGDTAQNYIDTSQTNVEALYRDTFQLNGQQVVRLRVATRFNNLTTLAGDTLVEATDSYFDCGFPDVDKDGYRDIRVYGVDNDPDQCDTYLYDKADKSYKEIKNADLNFQRLSGTNYYYSYNKTGLAECYWESHLMKIENWKAITIGRINVNACNDKNDGIQLYKVNEEDELLIGQLPSPVFNSKDPNYKWAYVKNYWAKNYMKFE